VYIKSQFCAYKRKISYTSDMKAPMLKNNRRRLAVAGLIVLAIYIVLPQLKDFRSSWQVLGHLDYGWALLAVFFTGLTYLAAAGTYYWLAFKKLPYWQTAEIQLAAMFVNRLLPAGVTAIGHSACSPPC
jgi:uncharacterized membrane protein YbhN (UPF0104 family)